MLSLIVTPICKTYKKNGPCSRKDYEEQEKRMERGQQLMWDDSKQNDAKVGDVFGFVKNNIGVIFHRIESVHGPDHRLDTWNDDDHGGRNVLYLSEKIGKIDWNVWIRIGGSRKAQRTFKIQQKNSNELLFSVIRSL